MIIRYSLIILIILVLPGCFAKKRSKDQAVGFSFAQPSLNELRSPAHERISDEQTKSGLKSSHAIGKDMPGYESALFDIPMPFSSKSLNDYAHHDSTGTMVAQSVRNSRAELEKFYKISMEQSGWLEIAFFHGAKESVGIWKKSRKLCEISIRDASSKQSTVVITVNTKEEINS